MTPGEGSQKASDYWKDFEGIPLCHVPRSAEEEQALAKKGSCICGQ